MFLLSCMEVLKPTGSIRNQTVFMKIFRYYLHFSMISIHGVDAVSVMFSSVGIMVQK